MNNINNSSYFPPEWDTSSLDEILDFSNGINFSANQKGVKGVLTVDVLNMYGEELDVATDNLYRVDKTVQERKLLRNGDILFVRSSVKESGVGWAAMFSGCEEPVTYCGFIIRGQPKRNNFDPGFLIYYLRQPQVRKQMIASSGKTAITNISQERLKPLAIPLPPLKEQKRIAAILDKVDAIRRKRKEAIALTEELLRSTFLDMFGDPVTNPKGWEVRPLNSISDRIIDCPHSTPKWSETGLICLRISNLTVGGWNWDDIRYITEEDYQIRTQRSEIASGDIVLSREGTVGIAAIVPKDIKLCMGQRLVQVRPQTDYITSLYLLRILLWYLAPERLSQLMRGSTSKHLNVKDLRSMKIPVPPIKLQLEFSDLAAQINSLQEKMIDFSEEKDNNFNSLLQKAFRGEL